MWSLSGDLRPPLAQTLRNLVAEQLVVEVRGDSLHRIPTSLGRVRTRKESQNGSASLDPLPCGGDIGERGEIVNRVGRSWGAEPRPVRGEDQGCLRKENRFADHTGKRVHGCR